MPQYKNYAGDTITCPKAEGTCWQPEHLTKEQFKLQRKHLGPNGEISSIAGIAGDDSWVDYDYYDNYSEVRKKDGDRPKGHVAAEALFDFGKDALGEDTTVIVRVARDKNGDQPTDKGEIIIATAYESQDWVSKKAGDRRRFLDSVRYNFEVVDGQPKFFKKKMFSREELTAVQLQKDILKSRSDFNRDMGNRGGM